MHDCLDYTVGWRISTKLLSYADCQAAPKTMLYSCFCCFLCAPSSIIQITPVHISVQKVQERKHYRHSEDKVPDAFPANFVSPEGRAPVILGSAGMKGSCYCSPDGLVMNFKPPVTSRSQPYVEQSLKTNAMQSA